MFTVQMINVRCFHKFPLMYFGWLFLSVLKWETTTSSSYNKNEDEREAREGQESIYDAREGQELYDTRVTYANQITLSQSAQDCHLLYFQQ